MLQNLKAKLCTIKYGPHAKNGLQGKSEELFFKVEWFQKHSPRLYKNRELNV